jgi:hypothetical protein
VQAKYNVFNLLPGWVRPGHKGWEKCYTSVTIAGGGVTELDDTYFKMVVVVLQKHHYSVTQVFIIAGGSVTQVSP